MLEFSLEEEELCRVQLTAFVTAINSFVCVENTIRKSQRADDRSKSGKVDVLLGEFRKIPKRKGGFSTIQ